MLTQLLKRADVPHYPGFFMLGDVPVFMRDMGSPDTVELIPRPLMNCFVLRCWRVITGTPKPIPFTQVVYPGLCGDTLVLWADTRFTLTDKAGSPLPAIYYKGRDNRICNRMTANMLIDWTKAYE